MKVCLASSRLLWYPDLGGHVWVYMNWALGLQANGCEVTFLETLPEEVPPAKALERVRALGAQLEAVGLPSRTALLLSADQRERYRPVARELDELTFAADEVADASDVLVNFKYSLDPGLVASFKRKVLIDIDPGLLQLWVSEGQLSMAPHDVYFSIGETVGREGALFPDCGVSWHYTPPAVHLPAWPVTRADPDAPYTTVANWWAGWELYQREVFNNEKRTTFLEYLDLPSRVAVPLELALFIGPQTEEQERATLEQHGWGVLRSSDVCGTPARYQQYIQRSRGEFSCAKPSCMRLQNAWISDRTLGYLASGRPAIVQHTGPSGFLPDAEGLFRFRDMEEAVRALAAVENEYDRHARLARSLAERYFDAARVARRVLERSL